MYIHAVLACDGVSMFCVVDKRNVDTNQGCPICCQDLPSDDRCQATGNTQEERRENAEFMIYG